MQVKGSPTHGSHSRGTPSFPAQLNLSPFSPPDLDLRGDSPTLSGKGSHLPVAPQEEAGLALKLERKPRGSCHIPKDTPWISPSIQGNSRWLDTSANVTPRMKSTRRGTDTPVHHPEKSAGSKYSSTSCLSPCEQLKRQAEFHSPTQDEA